VLFGVNLGGLTHETLSAAGMRLGNEGEVRGLRMIAQIVPLGRELVIIGSRPMLFRGF
jgi:hypothetical protein